jgi:hypothetical protein
MRHRGRIQADSRRAANSAAEALRRPEKHVDNFVDNSIYVPPKSLILINRPTHRLKVMEKITFVIKPLQIAS